MKIFFIANQKGGCGKTTIVSNLGALLEKKHKVPLVDIDPQGNLTNHFDFSKAYSEVSSSNNVFLRGVSKSTFFQNISYLQNIGLITLIKKKIGRYCTMESQILLSDESIVKAELRKRLSAKHVFGIAICRCLNSYKKQSERRKRYIEIELVVLSWKVLESSPDC